VHLVIANFEKKKKKREELARYKQDSLVRCMFWCVDQVLTRTARIQILNSAKAQPTVAMNEISPFGAVRNNEFLFVALVRCEGKLPFLLGIL